MNLALNNQIFKKIIVIFWSIWWLIALWTDIVGGLAHWLNWQFSWAPDLNYPFLISSLKMYPLPAWVPFWLFIGIIVWSLLSTALFCWASIGIISKNKHWFSRTQTAFIVSLSYWLSFFIADQLVMNFNLEQNHMVQGGFQLLTFLALYLLPEN